MSHIFLWFAGRFELVTSIALRLAQLHGQLATRKNTTVLTLCGGTSQPKKQWWFFELDGPLCDGRVFEAIALGAICSRPTRASAHYLRELGWGGFGKDCPLRGSTQGK